MIEQIIIYDICGTVDNSVRGVCVLVLSENAILSNKTKTLTRQSFKAEISIDHMTSPISAGFLDAQR